MLAQRILNRLFRRQPASVVSRPPRLPFRRRALFEALESRVLLSADLAPNTENLISNGVQQLGTWAEGLANVEQLAKSLPVVNQTIGSSLNVAQIIHDRIVIPVQGYLAQGGTQTTDGIVSALNAVLGPGTVTGDRSATCRD